MGFKDLPNDLKNIVSDFAYKCKWETVENDLEMCKTIKKMQISDVFVSVEKWYRCLDFDIFQDADSENVIVKPDLVIDSGSPKKNL